MIDPDFVSEPPGNDRDSEDAQDQEPPPLWSWRRPVLIVVAVLTIAALALVPLYNVFANNPVADNGLEICGFDYCVVQDEVVAAGLDLVMSRLSNTFLDQGEARSLADELTEFLGIRPISLSVVDDLDGRIGGVYDPEIRAIAIESPARAWTVLHEVAHAVADGHDSEFRAVLVDLARHVAFGQDDTGESR